MKSDWGDYGGKWEPKKSQGWYEIIETEKEKNDGFFVKLTDKDIVKNIKNIKEN